MNQTILLILSFSLPFIMTFLGACLVFFFNKPSNLITKITFGFASGIMISASIWSLLIPSLEESENIYGSLAPLPVILGFLLGGLFIIILDFICHKLTKNSQEQNKEKAIKFFTAMTVHNIPEGISVGFAIGTAIATNNPILGAFMFSLGISLQNFPEGLATALPINTCLNSRTKGFIWGSLSGIVEPIFAVLGFYLASYLTGLLPWFLSFSAGAMIYVTIEELIPEIHNTNHLQYGSWFFIIGFILMMSLDICL